MNYRIGMLLKSRNGLTYRVTDIYRSKVDGVKNEWFLRVEVIEAEADVAELKGHTMTFAVMDLDEFVQDGRVRELLEVR